jgi:hypothetical protein
MLQLHIQKYKKPNLLQKISNNQIFSRVNSFAQRESVSKHDKRLAYTQSHPTLVVAHSAALPLQQSRFCLCVILCMYNRQKKIFLRTFTLDFKVLYCTPHNE